MGPLSIAFLGVFVGSLDSAVNIAFPAMSRAFGIGPATIKWVVISYVLTYALVSLGSGWLADRIGHATIFTTGLWLSALALGLSGLAPTYGLFLAVRAAQGVGAGLLYGSAPALVTLSVPASARGRGLGLLNLAIGLGFAAGPAIGGLLVEALDWRWVYLFRAPLMLLVAGSATLALRRAPAGERIPRQPVWPALTPAVLTATLLTLLANLAMFAVWLLVPYYLVDFLGRSPSLGGLLFLLTPLGTAMAAPLSGWGADRLGTRGPVVAGLALEGAGLFWVSQFGPTSHAGSVALALLLVGLGLGIFTVPNMSLVMGALPRARQGIAGGLVWMTRTFGVVLGASLASYVFDWRQRVTASFITAFRDAFLVSTAVCFGALLVSLIPTRRRD